MKINAAVQIVDIMISEGGEVLYELKTKKNKQDMEYFPGNIDNEKKKERA
jgi:hypothetical protein